MRVPIRVLLLGLVLAEIAAFALAGQAIGVLGTLGLTVVSTLAGVLLLRRQGVATLSRIRADMDARRAPTRALAETAMLGLGAVLMILPGWSPARSGCCCFCRLSAGCFGAPSAAGRKPGHFGGSRSGRLKPNWNWARAITGSPRGGIRHGSRPGPARRLSQPCCATGRRARRARNPDASARDHGRYRRKRRNAPGGV
jgi:hypothetical protein